MLNLKYMAEYKVTYKISNVHKCSRCCPLDTQPTSIQWSSSSHNFVSMPGVTAVLMLPTINLVKLTNQVAVSVCVSFNPGKLNTAQTHTDYLLVRTCYDAIALGFFPVLFFLMKNYLVIFLLSPSLSFGFSGSKPQSMILI